MRKVDRREERNKAMVFTLDDFCIVEAIFPGSVIGSVECICENCLCHFVAPCKDFLHETYECPNCQAETEPL